MAAPVPSRPARPVYVVTTGPTLFGVHRPVPLRAGHTRAHIVGFSEEAHARAMAASLEQYRDTYGRFPPRDMMLADVVASGKFTCTIDAIEHDEHDEHDDAAAAGSAAAAGLEAAAGSAATRWAASTGHSGGGGGNNNIVPAAAPVHTAPTQAAQAAQAAQAVQVELQCLDGLLARLCGTDILMAVLVWDLGAGAYDMDSILYQEDGFSWHVLHPSSSAEDVVAHLARAAAACSYETALLPKPVRKQDWRRDWPRDWRRDWPRNWLLNKPKNWPQHWPQGWFKLWAWIAFAIMC
jgi:hypothetical protein